MLSTRGTTAWTAAALALTVLGAGCSGGSPAGPASSSTSPPTASSTTAAASASSTPSPSATSSTPPSTSPSITAKKRTAAELRRALLGLKDVPAGFEREAGSGDAGEKASSKRSACAALVRLLNASKVPGSRAEAHVSFSGGQQGPYVDESLDALGTATAAKAFVAEFRSAVKKCRSLSVTIDGVGTSTLTVREISFADVGSTSFAARFSASNGALAGFELIQAGVQSGDVLVGMAFVGLDPADAEQATQDAVKKVENKLDTGDSI